MPDVTYTPQDGDPVSTEWQGVRFEANKAVSLDDNHQIIRLLGDGNAWFSVGSGGTDRKRGRPKKPTTTDEYMAYAVDWINKADNSRAMASRWDNEEPQRSALGWGSDDDDKIAVIYQPKFEAVKKAEQEMAG